MAPTRRELLPASRQPVPTTALHLLALLSGVPKPVIVQPYVDHFLFFVQRGRSLVVEERGKVRDGFVERFAIVVVFEVGVLVGCEFQQLL